MDDTETDAKMSLRKFAAEVRCREKQLPAVETVASGKAIAVEIWLPSATQFLLQGIAAKVHESQSR